MKRKKRTKSKSAPKVKRTKKPSPIIAIPLILISLFVLIATIYKIIEIISANNSAIDFPKLEISLTEVPIEQIDAGTKDIKYPENAISITADGKTTTYDNVEVKGRGNYTWGQIKKPYQIKFSEKTSLLDHDATKKWVLLANYLDQTHLRNDAAFHLADILDESYTYQGNPIELYIDNNYRGLYYLVKKISTDKAGLNLKNDDGVLLELDNLYGKLDGCAYDKKSNCFIVKDIINEGYTEAATTSFISSINSLHKAIENQDYSSITEIIDIDSFAKYFLLSEFTVNPDAYSSSLYMYRDGEKDKIHAGPIWDFDMALGNKYWKKDDIDFEKIHSPFEDMVFKNYLPDPNSSDTRSVTSTLFYDLMNIPEFEARVKEIYQSTLSGKKDDFINYIKSQADYIRPAAFRDQERWKLKTNFDEEVDYLIDWVSKRYDHFEEVYGQNPTEPTPNPAPESPQPSQEQSSPQETPPSA